MINGQNTANNGAGKTYAVNIQAKAQSSNSCSFCWFVVTLYPTLKGMTERDHTTYKAHLEKSHGLRADIQP